MKHALALLALTAAPLGITAVTPAAAEQTPDKARVVTTEDGWQLRVGKITETLDRVPALSGSPFTREGFVSLEATADIAGQGKVPVDAGTLAVGYQIGCQADVSSGLGLAMSAAIGPNVGVSIGPAPGASVGMSALALPTVSTTLKPGTVTSLPFATKPLAGRHASISASQIQIKIDSCLGQASLRSYAIVSISTRTALSTIAVYGDPIWL